MPELSEMTVQALRARQALGRTILRQIRNVWCDDDRAQDAQRHYEQQVKAITAELRRRRRAARQANGEDKPPTQTMRMKVATLGAKAGRR